MAADDNDADTTVTAFIDCDGAYIRPARTTLLHAMDDSRNAALTGSHRMPMDRFRAESVRHGRNPNVGRNLRLLFYSLRAGDALAIRSISLDVSVRAPKARLAAKDTTTRTDCDGAKIMVPDVTCMYASDSSLNSALTVQHTVQDRVYARFGIAEGRATSTHRVMLFSLRAGDAFSVRSLGLELDQGGNTRVVGAST